MIVIYPMLTAQMTGHVIPGVCKALEKYLIVYRLDDLLKASGLIGLVSLSKAVKTGGKVMLRMKEGVDYEVLESTGYFQEHMLKKLKEDDKKVNKKGEVSKDQNLTIDFNKKSGKTDIYAPDQNGLSLEPTWLKIDTPMGTKLLGVKVIPFPVKSDTSLARALLDDAASSKIISATKKVLRSSVSMLHSLYRGLQLHKILPNINLSGNPMKDIVYGSTLYGRNVFALINQADLDDDVTLRNIKNVDRLFFLKWNTFVVADDVKKQISFCTKEFKGLCSTVLYQYLFSSLGKDQHKVFDTLDDVRKTASPFFRMKKKMTTLFNSLANEKMEKYRMTEAKTYDSVQSHLKKVKNPGDAKRHIEAMLIWLFKNKLLNDKGIKIIKQGLDKNTSITSDMLSPKGVKMLDTCYQSWADKVKYQKKIDIKSLDKCFKGVK